MGRILVLWCVVSIACGADKGTNEEAAAAPLASAPVEAAPPAAEPPPPTPRELERDATSVQCRRGDVEACATAATLSAGLGDETGARALHELGCLHGSAAACGALVAVSEFWLGAACRRGDEEACRNANTPRARGFRLIASTKGPVGERIRATYAASVEDCVVRHLGDVREVAATFSVREGHTADIATTPATGDLATCVRATIERWVFLDAGADGGPHEVSARFQTARAAAKERLEAEAEAMAMVLMLGSDDDNGGGMRHRKPGADLGRDLDTQIAEIKLGGAVGGHVGADAPRQGSAIGPASGPAVTIDSPSLRIAITEVTLVETSSVESTEVTAKVRRQYMAGLLRCYKERLKQDPDYAGTVRVSFTIQESGRAANVRAEAAPPAEDLAGCVRAVGGSWRFSVPRDDDGDPTAVDAVVALRFSVSG